MFFDESQEVNNFDSQLIEIAQLQNELLKLRYDSANRIPYSLPLKRKGLLGKEQVMPPLYMEKEVLLKEKQQSLIQQRLQCGYDNDVCWWNLPWERVIPILLYNLTFPQEEDEPDQSGWRRGFSFQQEYGVDGKQFLCLKMQAHYKKNSSSRNIKSIEYSAYTKEEREAMLDTYNNKRNLHAAMHITFADNVGVHSILTGQDYDTASKYYASGEYMAIRLHEAEQYRQSLYSEEERNTLYVSSSSMNRTSIHGVCSFHADESGKLDYMETLDFRELEASNRDTDASEEFFMTRDAAVIGAMLLAENRSVGIVPLSLFEKGFNSDNYADVIRLAEILTCLAPKLKRR